MGRSLIHTHTADAAVPGRNSADCALEVSATGCHIVLASLWNESNGPCYSRHDARERERPSHVWQILPHLMGVVGERGPGRGSPLYPYACRLLAVGLY